jgi:hypothetical protein
MPTDPFVPPDPSARPRQQQNLPPGVALPPARSWRATRPGDLAAGWVEGPLLGRPGPNVGYSYTLAKRAADRLRLAPHEHLDDAIAVVAEIAGKRATLFGRAPVIGDIDVAVMLLGYDGSADDAFAEARSQLVHEAAHNYPRRRAIVDSVPDDLLRRRNSELKGLVGAWRENLPQLHDV